MQGLISRISSAHVIALIALFVALGGGAAAFSGSGTLQKAGLTGVTTSVNFENLRVLNGFGTLQVRCDTGDDEMDYRLDNTTSSVINIHFGSEAGGSTGTDVANPGGTSTAFFSGGSEGSSRVHLFKEGATSKSGVEIVVSNDGPFANNCGTADVRVMALNTVE